MKRMQKAISMSRSPWRHPCRTVPWMDPERIAGLKLPFTATPRFRFLVGAGVVVGAGLLVFLLRVLLGAEPDFGGKPDFGGTTPPAAPIPDGAPRIPFDGLLGADGGLDDQSDGYLAVVSHLLREPQSGAARIVSPVAVTMQSLREESAAFRGEMVRVEGLFLHSSPVRLEKKRGEVEWIHRTFLVDQGGKECCVIDLIERPRAAPRETVQTDAVLVRLSRYEAVRGPVEVPHLVGRGLSRREAASMGAEKSP